MVTLTLLDPQTLKPIKNWEFSNPTLIRIGRLPDNDIVIDNVPEVSRYHVEIRHQNNQWQVINKGTNGTFVNGSLVTSATVTEGDLIRLAQSGPTLKFSQLQSIIEPENKTKQQICTHQGNAANTLFCIYCGQPIVEKQEFIRHYQILKLLGRGGMGTTYLAWDKKDTNTPTPKLVVLKEMNADMAQIAKARELFEREARILKSLTHPYIPKYYDFFVEADKKYLAMELIHGENLELRIYNKGPVTPEQAIKWMIQVCDILVYLHSLTPPLVHRDVKPANLMVRHKDNSVILLDFGAVKEIGTPPGTRIGAEGYSAPEQNRGKPCPQSDLYAIGPTLIFLITGKGPNNYLRRRLNEFYYDLTAIDEIYPKLSRVISKASSQKIEARYQKAQDLADALAACL